MIHIAIQENLDGKVVEWMEHVSEEQYRQEDRKAGKRGKAIHRDTSICKLKIFSDVVSAGARLRYFY